MNCIKTLEIVNIVKWVEKRYYRWLINRMKQIWYHIDLQERAKNWLSSGTVHLAFILVKPLLLFSGKFGAIVLPIANRRKFHPSFYHPFDYFMLIIYQWNPISHLTIWVNIIAKSIVPNQITNCQRQYKYWKLNNF